MKTTIRIIASLLIVMGFFACMTGIAAAQPIDPEEEGLVTMTTESWSTVLIMQLTVDHYGALPIPKPQPVDGFSGVPLPQPVPEPVDYYTGVPLPEPVPEPLDEFAGVPLSQPVPQPFDMVAVWRELPWAF